jgi:magnesium-transporting ATPase (P-type)
MSDDQIQSERPDPRDIAKQPRPFGERPAYGDMKNDLPRLGSLAQSARNKHLKQARNTLLWVGILMGVVQGAFFFVEMGQVKDEIRKAGVAPAQAQQAETTAQIFLKLFHGSAIAVSVIFVAMSFFVQRHPVPILVTALALFIGLQVVFALADPMNIVRGAIVKIIVIVALAKALQAGIAAQREEREAQAAAEYGAQNYP